MDLTLEDTLKCSICKERQANIVFLNCYHVACCERCCSIVNECTICKSVIKVKNKLTINKENLINQGKKCEFCDNQKISVINYPCRHLMSCINCYASVMEHSLFRCNKCREVVWRTVSVLR